MCDATYEPETNLALGQSTTLAEESIALATNLEDSFFETRRLRPDGWGGPEKAVFCRTLAETGVVTDACRACGMSAQSAYALRHRDPSSPAPGRSPWPWPASASPTNCSPAR